MKADKAIEILEYFKHYLFEDHSVYCGFRKADFFKAIKEVETLEELENRSCSNCKFKDVSIRGICFCKHNIMEDDHFPNKKFYCSFWEKNNELLNFNVYYGFCYRLYGLLYCAK